jgi:crotonobetainyl-CoA:carnitine CoA-transferase CaiB-like acyl-CoA transferase
MAIEVDCPGRGSVRMKGFPVKLSATPCQAPELGARTDEVLRERGLEAAIPRLRAKGIV